MQVCLKNFQEAKSKDNFQEQSIITIFDILAIFNKEILRIYYMFIVCTLY